MSNDPIANEQIAENMDHGQNLPVEKNDDGIVNLHVRKALDAVLAQDSEAIDDSFNSFNSYGRGTP